MSDTSRDPAAWIAARGPRWALTQQLAGLGSGSRVAYAATAEQAERIRLGWEADQGAYAIHVAPPEGSIDLTAVARALAEARQRAEEQTQIARAATLRAAEEGRSEHAIARGLGVDRMTVRRWLGKDSR